MRICLLHFIDFEMSIFLYFVNVVIITNYIIRFSTAFDINFLGSVLTSFTLKVSVDTVIDFLLL